MEKTRDAVVVPATFGWSDVGSWSALWELGAKDALGNVSQGDVQRATATAATCERATAGSVAAVGVENLVVSRRATRSSSPRASADDVKLRSSS